MVAGLSASVLGQRIRQLRSRSGLTQDDLAGGDYSKSYISAIEQGKTRPSLGALQRICARLNVSPGLLLDPEAEGFAPYDPDAMPRRVRRKRKGRGGYGPGLEGARIEYAINMAEVAIYTGRAAEALKSLLSLLPQGGEAGGKSDDPARDPTYRARIYALITLAATETGDGDSAVRYATTALEAARALGDRTGIERARNMLGRAYMLNDEPLTALEQHRACLEGIRSGQVRDPNLRLQIYHNLASDYLALNDTERARNTYRDALDDIHAADRPVAQAEANRSLAEHLGGLHLYEPAAPYSARAAGIHEAVSNLKLVARMENRYSDMLVEVGEMEEAETYLGRSLSLAECLNSETDKALALTNLARYEMKRGNLAQADAHAQSAISLVRPAKTSGKAGRKTTRDAALSLDSARALSRALAMAGEIASQRGEAEGADRMFSEAIEVLEASHASEGGEIYQRYAQTLASRGEHEQASRYYERAYQSATQGRR
jgi:tetratricopeptide (TPR) repeat protein/DNA-binding XRE family transcriptional regulator